MKLKINWKELMRQLWAAVKPVLLDAIGGGIVGFASGCSSMAPSDKTQTMSVVRARHSRNCRHHRIAANGRQRRKRLKRRRAIKPAHGEVKLHCAL